MAARLAVLSDIHGNLAALEAVLPELERQAPDGVLVCGDLVLNGPRPSETVRAVMRLEASGALVISGNTDIAVADGDYTAAFPWLDEVPVSHRAAAEWAREQLADEELAWLRRLPAERRTWVEDQLVLACHASPGSQTAGLPRDLDPSVLVERVTRTDARVICCGHTHVADVHELGARLVLNPGSCGYAFDGDPGAAWAMLTIAAGEAPVAELLRTPYDAQGVAEEISQRGLPGDVYRAATVRTGRFVR